MNSTYEAFITIAKNSNIDMDSLFAYYKAKEVKTEEVKTEEVKTEEVKTEEVKTEEVKTGEVKTEEVKTEEVKTEEVKTEEVKTEEVKTEEVKTEEVKTEEVKTEEVKTEEVKTENKPWPIFQTREKSKSWADYEDEDDEDDRKLEEKKAPDAKSYRDVVSPNSQSKKILSKTSSTSDEWETLPTEDEFIKVSKKHIHKKNLPVVHSLEEFINCIKEKKKPNIDFIIHDTAHCSHTFEGTLCKDVRRCKKIHIQRCIAGEKCKNKICPYLHRFDMPSNEAKTSFTDTMDMYNKIKPKKQVKAVN
jgi:hypothetical protein